MTSAFMPLETKPSQKIIILNKKIQESLSLIFTSFYKCRGELCSEIEQRTQEIQKILEQLQEYCSHDYLNEEEEKIYLENNVLKIYQDILWDVRALTTLTRTKNMEKILFMEKTLMEINELFCGLNSLFTHVNDTILIKNPILLERIAEEREKYKKLSRKFAQPHEERLVSGFCLARSSSLYLSLLNSIEDILWNIQKIVDELGR